MSFQVNYVNLTNLKQRIKQGKFVRKIRKLTRNEPEIDLLDEVYIKETKPNYDYEKEYNDNLNDAIDTSINKFHILDVVRARLEILEENLGKMHFI